MIRLYYLGNLNGVLWYFIITTGYVFYAYEFTIGYIKDLTKIIEGDNFIMQAESYPPKFLGVYTGKKSF